MYKDIISNDWDKLRESVPSFNVRDKKLRDDITTRLKSYLGKTEHPFMGLSGIQVGVDFNCTLLRLKGWKEHRVVFNLKVDKEIGSQISRERCMSEPLVHYIVKRPFIILASWTEANGKRKSEWLKDRNAAIFCHEYDHQNGILIHDIGEVDEKSTSRISS